MPRERSAQPAYRYHTSGQARVTLGDKVFYLGKHGTPESYARYYSLLAEYNANGKEPPAGGSSEPETHQADAEILIKHVTADFRARELPNYKSNEANHNRFDNLCKLLDSVHGKEPVSEFGPRKLEALRDSILKVGIGQEKQSPVSRQYCNDLIRKLITIIRHGVSRELVQPDRIVALESLPPLKRGQAKEGKKRKGVPVESVRATVPFLTKTAAAMVEIQLATAMRPSELFRMTPAMIDRSGKVWFYRPDEHKTEHRDKQKAVPILGKALEVLTPYLFGDPDELCFTTLIGTPWNKDNYRHAVVRAAKLAKVPHWTPYQLRHTTGQATRDKAGPEATQALLGHSRLSTTEIYAKASEAKAIAAAKVAPRL
ncbi:MAG: tyrosine-type recombinase/integrase [Rubripirellula sp.]